MDDLQLEEFCQLISADRSHSPIELMDGKPLLIGRGPLTCITDRKVSRNHVEVTANFATKELTIKQLGANSSRVAGRELPRNESSILGQMGKFELVPDKYKYHVHFGQRVPESILEKMKQGADDHNALSDSEDIVEDHPSNSSFLESGESKKRKRDRNDTPETTSRIMHDGGQDIPVTPPTKKSKLDNPKTSKKRKRDRSDTPETSRIMHDSVQDIPVTPPTKKSKLDNPKTAVHKGSDSGVSKPQQTALTTFYKPKSSSSDDDTGSSAGAKPMTPQWEEKGSMLILRFGEPVASAKIASYDLDGTLIETASGRKFATSASDWKLLPKVTNKLHSLHGDGYRIVIISNQLGISRGKPTAGEFKQKAEAIARALKVPLLLLAATAKDKYRKPCLGMWEHMTSVENGGLSLDTKDSFYVGDAAGREANWKHGAKKDFSCTDRKFAANLNLPFFTPEEHFQGLPKSSKFSWGDFDPRTLDYSKTGPTIEPTSAMLHSTTQELVIFVGCPASGKSTFFAKFMKPKGYIHINRDTLGSWQKCVAECDKVLLAGKSAVIDNTSPDKESRLRYTEVARKHKVSVRCFQFMTTIAHAKHNNRFRELTLKSSKHAKVNDMVFNTYKSKFCEPVLGEGFSEIVKIHFTPSLDNDHHAQLYKSFLD